jgi:putative transposon-encoded protein
MRKINGKGRLVLSEVKFDSVYSAIVKPHSDTAGRIYVPVGLVGKRVYILEGVDI